MTKREKEELEKKEREAQQGEKQEQEGEVKKRKVDGMSMYEKVKEKEQLVVPVWQKKSLTKQDGGGADDDDVDDDDDDVDKELPSRAEVFRLLRLRNEPVTLFGENDRHRVRRLRRVEAAKRAEQDEAAGTQQIQMGEDKDAEERAEQTDWDNVQKSCGKAIIFLTGGGGDDQQQQQQGGNEELRWIMQLLMKQREEKKTSRQEKLVWRQTLQHVVPLVEGLARGTLPSDVMGPLSKVVEWAKKREYAKAEDAYLLLAIGKSAWPMGVTSVGIHERSAREKIGAGNTAHVLNDETTRKYVQCIKRLLTYCAKKYPNEGKTYWDTM